MDSLTLAFSAAQVAEGLPQSVMTMVSIITGMMKGKKSSPDAGSRDFALAAPAYEEFLSYATHAHCRLGFIARIGVPPSLVGGLWSYPAMIRAQREFGDYGNKMVVAFAKIIMLGSDETAAAGFNVTTAFGEEVSSMAMEGSVFRAQFRGGPEFESKATATSLAIREFALTARDDLMSLSADENRNRPEK